MKPIKKKPAIFLIVIIAVAVVLGSLFAFVPMTFGHTRYNSFAGAIRVGNDFSAGMYAEYDISPDGSNKQADIEKSIIDIKSVLIEKGYASTNVYSVDNSMIRVEVSYPSGGSAFSDAYTLLQAVGVGKFELRSSSSEDDTYIIGSKHISGVTISNYTSYIYVTLEFNDAGVEAYQKLLDASDTIYVCMGGATQTSFSSKEITTASSSLPLTFTDYKSALDFATKVRFGSIPVELNKDTVVINTVGVRASILACIIALGIVVVGALVFMALRYGIIGLLSIVSTIISAICCAILFWAVELIEINISSLLAMVLGFGIMTILKTIYAERVREEFLSGKTIEASLEAGYKKSIAGIVAPAVMVLIITAIMAFVATGILQTASIIVIIMTLLGVIESLVLLPGFVNIVETFNKGKETIYHFKREEV